MAKRKTTTRTKKTTTKTKKTTTRTNTKPPDFVKSSTLKSFILRQRKLRSSADAMREIEERFNAAIVDVVVHAGKLAKDARKKTIGVEHVRESFDTVLGKKKLTDAEVLEQVLQLSPAELGKVRTGIRRAVAAAEKGKKK